jgi:hypothetical protein
MRRKVAADQEGQEVCQEEIGDVNFLIYEGKLNECPAGPLLKSIPFAWITIHGRYPELYGFFI